MAKHSMPPEVAERARRKLKELEDSERERVLGRSVDWKPRRVELGRAAMPPADANESDVGDGARQKKPMRYD